MCTIPESLAYLTDRGWYLYQVNQAPDSRRDQWAVTLREPSNQWLVFIQAATLDLALELAVDRIDSPEFAPLAGPTCVIEKPVDVRAMLGLDQPAIKRRI